MKEFYKKIEKATRDVLIWSKAFVKKTDIESPEFLCEPPTAAKVDDTLTCTPENKPFDDLSS